MGFFKRLIDLITLRTDRPIKRLLAYYVVLGVVIAGLSYAFPVVDRMFSGEQQERVESPQLLQDGLANAAEAPAARDRSARLQLAIKTVVICFGTLALMLPVSWVYMSARNTRGHSQSVVQTLIILPIIVAGIILIVSNSLALAFSLAGVVSVLRFRTTLSDTRDIMYIFLGVAVGFAAGVQLLMVAVVLSVVFNFVLLLSWHYDFGRNVLEPTAGSVWTGPLDALAQSKNGTKVPDRDLVLALTPKQVDNLAKRFERVRSVLGPGAKKPRYNGILTVTTNELAEAQDLVELALSKVLRRSKLDEVVTNSDKPSELYYLVKTGKSTSVDEVLTAIRTRAGRTVLSANLEIGDALARERAKKKAAAQPVTAV